MNPQERHYSIDPGKGAKMEGCPYSFHEDGHDVKDYIIPPKGYTFTGFRYEPLPNNQIYDGKLVAQYEKVSVHDRLTSNLWKILIPVSITTVISVVALLAVSVFSGPKSNQPRQPRKAPQTAIAAADSTEEANEVIAKAETETKEAAAKPETPAKPEQVPASAKPVAQPAPVQEPKETVAQTKPEAVAQPVQTVTQQTVTQEANDPNAKFNKEFWALVHKREPRMDSYHELYVNNKSKVSGDEFDYLRLVILKDYASFKAWHGKLKAIPESQLQTINTIPALRRAVQ